MLGRHLLSLPSGGGVNSSFLQPPFPKPGKKCKPLVRAAGFPSDSARRKVKRSVEFRRSLRKAETFGALVAFSTGGS
jgi:hypothetical protein